MSLRRPAKDQPQDFEFNSSSLEAANKIIANYPKGKQKGFFRTHHKKRAFVHTEIPSTFSQLSSSFNRQMALFYLSF